jgi:hypothetical protein
MGLAAILSPAKDASVWLVTKSPTRNNAGSDMVSVPRGRATGLLKDSLQWPIGFAVNSGVAVKEKKRYGVVTTHSV